MDKYATWLTDKENNIVAPRTLVEVVQDANGKTLDKILADLPSGGGGAGVIDDTPIGNVIAFMGITPPKHYLACDGTVYNISKYSKLAEFIKTQFGSYNFFGGDGTTTFAVPDLRGEFLRGTGENSHENQGSGLNVGEHQDATEHITIAVDANQGNIFIAQSSTTVDAVSTSDSGYSSYPSIGRANISKSNEPYTDRPSLYTSRPTNTSVLYCIKYELSENGIGIGYDDYSEEEHVIGKWIDGKPIYRKCLVLLNQQLNGHSEGFDDFPHGIQNIDNYVKIGGHLNVSGGTSYLNLPHLNIWKLEFGAGCWADNNDMIRINVAADMYGIYNIYINIEYTKTTDAPDSFTPDMVYNGMIDSSDATDEEVKEILS